jgi:hypothetical protein
LSLTRQLFEAPRRTDAPLQLGALGALGGQDYIKKLRVKYAGFNQRGLIDDLLTTGVGPRQKYLAWILAQLADRYGPGGHPRDSMVEELVVLVDEFHANRMRLVGKDLYRYSPVSLRTALDHLSVRRRLRNQGSSPLVIAETPEYVVVYLKTHEDACFFGRGTKWCIAETEIANFNIYAVQNLGSYLLFNRRLSSKDALYKVALQEPQGPHSTSALLAAIDVQRLGPGDGRSSLITDARDSTVTPHAVAQSLDRKRGLDVHYDDGYEQLRDIFTRIYKHSIKQPRRPEYLKLPVQERLQKATSMEDIIWNLENATADERQHQLDWIIKMAGQSWAVRKAENSGLANAYDFWQPAVWHSDVLVRLFVASWCHNTRALMELVKNEDEEGMVLGELAHRSDRPRFMTWWMAANLLLRPYKAVVRNGENRIWREILLAQLYEHTVDLHSWSGADDDRGVFVRTVYKFLELATSKHADGLPYAYVAVFLERLLERADLGELTKPVHKVTWQHILADVDLKLSAQIESFGDASGLFRSLFNGPSAYKAMSEGLAQKYLDFSERRIAREPPDRRYKFHKAFGEPFVRSKKISDAALDILARIPELEKLVRDRRSAALGSFTMR